MRFNYFMEFIVPGWVRSMMIKPSIFELSIDVTISNLIFMHRFGLFIDSFIWSVPRTKCIFTKSSKCTIIYYENDKQKWKLPHFHWQVILAWFDDKRKCSLEFSAYKLFMYVSVFMHRNPNAIRLIVWKMVFLISQSKLDVLRFEFVLNAKVGMYPFRSMETPIRYMESHICGWLIGELQKFS